MPAALRLAATPLAGKIIASKFCQFLRHPAIKIWRAADEPILRDYIEKPGMLVDVASACPGGYTM